MTSSDLFGILGYKSEADRIFSQRTRMFHKIVQMMKTLTSRGLTKSVSSHWDEHSYGVNWTDDGERWQISIFPDPVLSHYHLRYIGDIDHPNFGKAITNLAMVFPELNGEVLVELERVKKMEWHTSIPGAKKEKKSVVDQYVSSEPVFGKPETGRKSKK